MVVVYMRRFFINTVGDARACDIQHVVVHYSCSPRSGIFLYGHAGPMVRTPDATNAFVYTRNWLVDSLDLLPVGVTKQLRFF